MNRKLEERLRGFHAQFDRDYSGGRQRLMAALASGAAQTRASTEESVMKGRSVFPYVLGSAAGLLIAHEKRSLRYRRRIELRYKSGEVVNGWVFVAPKDEHSERDSSERQESMDWLHKNCVICIPHL